MTLEQLRSLYRTSENKKEIQEAGEFVKAGGSLCSNTPSIPAFFSDKSRTVKVNDVVHCIGFAQIGGGYCPRCKDLEYGKGREKTGGKLSVLEIQERLRNMSKKTADPDVERIKEAMF